MTHTIVEHLCHAERTHARHIARKASNPRAALGLAYERQVGKAFEAAGLPVEHNPWFTYNDAKFGQGFCSPDFLLPRGNIIIVVEVKLTWVPDALHKLRDLYCPVVATALHCPTMPLVICKNLTRDAPDAYHDIHLAVSFEPHLLHWLGVGPILKC